MTADAVAPQELPPVLIGRDSELTVVATAVETAVAGRGQVVVVEGEAGVGKSALIDAALAGVTGVTVLRAAAEEMEGHRPFGVWLDALRLTPQERNALAARADVDLASAEDLSAARFRTQEWLVGIVEARAARQPLVLVLEDLHWADTASLGLVHRLARVLPPLPVCIIASRRPVPRVAELLQLLESLQARAAAFVPLRPLTEAESDALIETLLGHPATPAVRERLAAAGGNPFYLVELIAALQQRPNALPDGDERTLVSAAVMRRLRFLDVDTLDLLRSGAILGSSFALSDLRLLTGRPAAALGAALRPALDAGVLTGTGDELAFRHDLVREALYDDASPAVRAGVHREAAAVLAAAGRSPLQVAEHLLRGAKPPDHEAVEWLHRAAREAAQRDPAVAFAFSERALELAAPEHPLRADVAADLALAAVALGRPAEAEALCRRALAQPAPAGREGALRLGLADAVLAQGRFGEAWTEAELASRSPMVSAGGQARALGWSALLALYAGDLPGAEAVAAAARDLANEAKDAPAEVGALHVLGQVAYCRGRLGDAAELAARAVADSSGHYLPGVLQALVAFESDRPAEGLQATVEAGRLAELQGNQAGVIFTLQAASYGSFLSGEWDDSIAAVEAASVLAETSGQGGRLATFCSMAQIALRREGPEAAEVWLSQVRAAAAGGEPAYRLGWPGWAEAASLAARGDLGQALDVLTAAWQSCQDLGIAFDDPFVGPDLAALAVQGDDVGLAATVATHLEALSELNPSVPSLRGAALRARGLATGDADVLLAALAAYRAGPRRPDAARTAEDAAMALAGAGRTEEARARAWESLELYQGIGASWAASRARAAFRETGIRLGSRVPRTRQAHGWGALTVSEAKVASLAAERLSNPEIADRLFISRRTVESHMSRALAKLGLRSRVELVELARTGLLDAPGDTVNPR